MKIAFKGAVAASLLVGLAGAAMAQSTTPPANSTGTVSGATSQGAATPGTNPGMANPMTAPGSAASGSAAPGLTTGSMANPAMPTVGQTPVNGQMNSGAKTGTDPNANAAAFSTPGSAAPATNANVATTPAKGANSFTKGEAQGRLSANGFTSVNNLTLDNSGVWRAEASKDGKSVKAWLDYKGQVGQD